MAKTIRSNSELNALANGKNLFPNGDFSNGTIYPWVKDSYSVENTVITYDDGRLKVYGDSSHDGAYYQLTGLVVGTTYEVTCDFELGTATEANLRIQHGLEGMIRNSGDKFVGVATGTTVAFLARTGASTGTVWFNNISVKEVPQVQGENLPDYVATRSNFGFKNHIINGGFDIWQRGTSRALQSASYSADRWSMGEYQEGAHEKVTSTINGRPVNAIRVSSSSVAEAAGGTRMVVGQMIESENCKSLSGQTVTMSAYIKFSTSTFPGGGDFMTTLNEYTGVNPSFVATSPTTSQRQYISNGTLPTVWTKIVFTTTLASLSTLSLRFLFSGLISTTNNSDLYYDIAQVQLEEGSIATPFEQRPIGLELSLCQRYFRTTTEGLNFSSGGYIEEQVPSNIANTATFGFTVEFGQEMRITPTVTTYAFPSGTAGTIRNAATGTDINVLVEGRNNQRFTLTNQSGTTVTAGSKLRFHYTEDAEL